MSQGDSLTTQPVEALYINHHSWLYQWLRRRLGNSCDAADIAQDTFMRLLTRQQKDQVKEPRAYLSTIARGLVVDHWRRRELEQAWLETLAALPEAEAPSPEHHALLLEALREIDRLLDSLKPRMRRVFLMAQLDGLTCPQIALQLDISRSTVERDLATALRACYALYFEG